VQLVEEFDAILELVGYSTIIDSLKIVDRGGRVCLAGFLGGLASIPDSNTVLQMASGVHFSFFGSFAFGSPEFPLSDVPLQEVVQIATSGELDAKPWRVFRFEGIEALDFLAWNAAKARGGAVIFDYLDSALDGQVDLRERIRALQKLQYVVMHLIVVHTTFETAVKAGPSHHVEILPPFLQPFYWEHSKSTLC
jgi:hypothetical protein